jgi:hypothetical protein
LIVNPTDEFLAESLSLLDSDEGLKIESKTSSKKIFINKNLLGDYVLLMIYYSATNKAYSFLNCNRNYTDNREYINRGIAYLKTIPEVLELIDSEFEEIRVNEY